MSKDGWIEYAVKFRWCSNSKSTLFRYADPKVPQLVQLEDSCNQFVQRNQKAPVQMRFKIKFMTALKKFRRFAFTPLGLLILGELALVIFFIVFMISLRIIMFGG